MDSRNVDTLLQGEFSGDPPGQVFRVKARMDSASAFVQVGRSLARRRLVAIIAAAIFVIAGSFLLGRCSVAPRSPQGAIERVVASAGDTVVVSSDVVVWLEAARFFKQLGMEDRMARALDHAGRLLPRDTILTDDASKPVFVVIRPSGSQEKEGVRPVHAADQSESEVNMNRVMAQVLGD